MKDGHELWREPVLPDQAVVVSGERVFVAAGEAVQALQVADRAVVWRTPTGTATAPLIVKDGWVVVATAKGTFALRESDGSIVWQREAPPQRERAAIDGNTLIVPLADGRLQALDLATGATKWERPFGAFLTEPLVLGERIYIGATNKVFYCVKSSNGEEAWKWDVGSAIRGRAATDGRRVYYVALDNVIRAVDAGSGALKWQQGVRFRPFGGPTVAGGSIFIAGPTPVVRILHAADGKDGGAVTFPDSLVITPSIGTLTTGQVVIAGVSGGLNESWKLWLASPVDAAKPAGITATPRH